MPARVDASLRTFRWRIAAPAGLSLETAVLTIRGEPQPLDQEGCGACDDRADLLPFAVECPGCRPATGQLLPVTLPGERTEIVLRALPRLLVRAIDEQGAPVACADVWLATEWMTLEALRNATNVPHAVTDDQGQAVFAALADGQVRIHAHHESLVYSHKSQPQNAEGRSNITVQVPDQERATIRFSVPYVLAFQVDGAEVLSAGFETINSPFHSPINRDGQAALREVQEQLKARFPAATFLLQLRDPDSPELQARLAARPPDFRAKIFVAGRAPLAVPLQPVPLPEFVGPVRIDAATMPPSPDYGSIVVHVRDAAGVALPAVTLLLDGLFAGRPAAGLMLTLRSEERRTVPAGNYQLRRGNEPFLDGMVLETMPCAVRPGELCEVTLGSEFLWSRVRFTVTGGPRSGSGGLLIEHPATKRSTMQLLATLADAVECWVPNGEIRSTVTIGAADPDKIWRSRVTSIAVGGVPGAPQVVVHELRLEAR